MFEKLKQILSGNTEKGSRQVYIDELRVIATVFVIGTHTVSTAASMIETGSVAYRILMIFDFIFHSCNPLFIMISGALLLPVQGETIGAFFRKRFTKVAIPMVVYYILYVAAREGIIWLRPDHWIPLLKQILTGAPVAAPHLWLVYVILWLYVLTPFLRYIVHNIPDSVLNGVMLVVLVVYMLNTYLQFLGIRSVFGTVVDSYAGTFLLGYFLMKKCKKCYENVFFIAAFIALLGTMLWIWNGNNYADYIYNNSFAMICFTAGIILLVKRVSRQKIKSSFLVQLISKYSYSILLIHWGVLFFVVKRILHVNIIGGGIVGGCVTTIILTLFLSIIGAMILDNTLIKWIQIPFTKK